MMVVGMFVLWIFFMSVWMLTVSNALLKSSETTMVRLAGAF